MTISNVETQLEFARDALMLPNSPGEGEIHGSIVHCFSYLDHAWRDLIGGCGSFTLPEELEALKAKLVALEARSKDESFKFEYQLELRNAVLEMTAGFSRLSSEQE